MIPSFLVWSILLTLGPEPFLHIERLRQHGARDGVIQWSITCEGVFCDRRDEMPGEFRDHRYPAFQATTGTPAPFWVEPSRFRISLCFHCSITAFPLCTVSKASPEACTFLLYSTPAIVRYEEIPQSYEADEETPTADRPTTLSFVHTLWRIEETGLFDSGFHLTSTFT